MIVMPVFTMAQVLLRVFVEGLLTAKRAEVVGLSFVLRRASRGRGVNVHAAYEVFNCSCHELSFQLDYPTILYLR